MVALVLLGASPSPARLHLAAPPRSSRTAAAAEGQRRVAAASTAAIAAAAVYGRLSRRRHLVLGGGAAAFLCEENARAEVAGSSGTVREAIANFASGLPGYGPSDVYYPDWFLGTWDVTSELASVQVPQGEQLAGPAALKAREEIGKIEKFSQRYSDYNGKIIADRGFNISSLVGPRVTESIQWDPSNPNVLSMVMKRDGVSIPTDIRVTKRAVGRPEGRDDLFNMSEFYQEVIGGGPDPEAIVLGRNSQAPGSAAPKVTPVRCVNKFKLVKGPQIQALQRLEVFPQIGENARDFGEIIRGNGADREKPVVIYKYRAILVPSSNTPTEQEPQAPAQKW